jgi:hypothetical protein
VLWSEGGTTTVVFSFGGGVLLLLMHPDSSGMAANRPARIFIAFSSDRLCARATGCATPRGEVPAL